MKNNQYLIKVKRKETKTRAKIGELAELATTGNRAHAGSVQNAISSIVTD